MDDVVKKPSCRSRRTADKLFAINESVQLVISNSEDIRDETRTRCFQRFTEIYETAIKKNILIGGECWEQSQVDVTPEYEAFDTARLKFFQQELYPDLNDAMVEVTKKRKECSYAIKKYTVKHREANANHYSRVRIDCPRKEIPDLKEKSTLNEAVDMLRKTSEDICDVNKRMLEAQSCLTRVDAALRIQESVEDKQNDILYTSLVQVETTTTPLKQKLNKLNNLDSLDVGRKISTVRQQFSARHSYRGICKIALKEKI